MSNSIEGTVNVALALQNQVTLEQKNNLLLRKAWDNQSSMVSSLMDSIPDTQQLASGGTVGTRLHVTA